nr:30S ribosomal protein S13 [Candidatus Bathyarchaeota archaeon]
DAVSNPSSVGIPSWMLNRQKDLETGKDLHLIGSQLALTVKNDIELMKRIRCWKGVRHALGLKVRGQRTKTTGRKGQTVGVRRKKR